MDVEGGGVRAAAPALEGVLDTKVGGTAAVLLAALRQRCPVIHSRPRIKEHTIDDMNLDKRSVGI